MHRMSVRPQSTVYRNINQDNYLIHGLADSIVNKNDLNICKYCFYTKYKKCSMQE